MPRLSDTMTEGKVSSWLKSVGDKIAEGDILAEIETDKAVQDFESEYEGVLLYQGVKEGEAAPVDTVLAIIGEEGEDISSYLSGSSASEDEKKSAQEKSAEKQEKQTSDTETAKQTSEAPAALPENVHTITMPRLSDTMTEGKVASWNLNVGDEVKEGDVIAEIETDKAVQEFESEYDGVLLHKGVEEGEAVPVDSILAIIGPAGTDVSGMLSETGSKMTENLKEDEKNIPEEHKVQNTQKSENTKSEVRQSSKPSDTEKTAVKREGERLFVSPLARKIAEEKGIDLTQVEGSGDNGRIVRKDVENFTPKKAAEKAAAPAQVGQPLAESVEIPNSQVRNVIAKRLSESKFTAPHYYLFTEVRMDAAIAARKSLNSTPEVKISFNDMIIKAAAVALKKHPQINASWKGDHILQHAEVNIGVAVAIPDGLVVPVVKNADAKTFSQISSEVKELASAAKGKGLKVNQMEGSTFSVSNLGMFGIESFTSIINQPNSCILSVGAIIEKPVVENGQIVVGNTMKLSMACDHRVVDGATGAAFLQTLKMYLENPLSMFL